MTNRINFPSLTDNHSGAKHFRNLGGGVESRHAGYSENEGQCIGLPKGTSKLVNTERFIAPVALSYRKTDSRILNPSPNRDRGDLPAQFNLATALAAISALITVAGFITFVVIKLTK